MDPLSQGDLAQVLASLSGELLTSLSLRDDLDRLVQVGCRAIPQCSGASVTMLVDGSPTTVALSDTVALELDLVQYTDDEGPCVTALGGSVIRVGFVADDERFPHFAIGAADRRVLSVLSTPIVDNEEVLGSLNLYSREAHAFDADAERTALVIAAQAAVALARSNLLVTAHDTRSRLQQRYDESILVARASGVLMGINDCTSDQAARLLAHAADEDGESLVTAARRIMSTLARRQDDLNDD